MIIAYLLVLFGIAIFYIATFKYKYRKRKKIDSKQKLLKPLFGMAMFISDRLPKGITENNSRINKTIKALSVKEDIKIERYFYIVNKVAFSICIVLASLIIGLGCCLNEKEIEKITSLNRSDHKITSHFFVAKDQEGNEKDISLDVAKREPDDKEKRNIIEKSKKNLVKQVIDKNKSVDRITSDLNLVNRIKNTDINVSWNISDADIIGYDGVISDMVPKDGQIVTLTATLDWDGLVEEYMFSINVFPKEDGNVESELQKYVDNNDVNSMKVKLPVNIGNKKYIYFKREDKYGVWILPIGIVIAVILFFLKDKDLNSDLKKRNRQMIMDYPEIVSKILVYYDAGLSMKSCFKRISDTYKKQRSDRQKFRYAYEEIEMATIKMNSGVSEVNAISEFGQRCGVHCYLKLSNIIEQNIKRGSRDMISALKLELNNATIERRNAALKEGSEISTKLLGPMLLMLVISIIVIMAPAFMSIKV